MKFPELKPEYWDLQFKNKRLGWDIGYVSTPLKEYFEQIRDKTIRILIPGAGNAYEAEYLYNLGFNNIFVLDFSKEALASFSKRCPFFPENNIIHENFFEYKGTYDLIVEQAFFTSFPSSFRKSYVLKMRELLKDNGKLVGLWFTHHFHNNYPPYGGIKEEYEELFSPYFDFKIFDIAYNSIKPRKDREFFILMQKKN